MELEKGRALIVDDDPAICVLIGDILGEAGLSTVKVQTDIAAYSVLSCVQSFSAVILDINLGKGTTGFDVARFARQVIPSIKVVYLSGNSSEESFRALGVPDSAFLEKPFNPQALLSALDPKSVPWLNVP
jgi:CheY-like chemotaxis protein